MDAKLTEFCYKMELVEYVKFLIAFIMITQYDKCVI